MHAAYGRNVFHSGSYLHRHCQLIRNRQLWIAQVCIPCSVIAVSKKACKITKLHKLEYHAVRFAGQRYANLNREIYFEISEDDAAVSFAEVYEFSLYVYFPLTNQNFGIFRRRDSFCEYFSRVDEYLTSKVEGVYCAFFRPATIEGGDSWWESEGRRFDRTEGNMFARFLRNVLSFITIDCQLPTYYYELTCQNTTLPF